MDQKTDESARIDKYDQSNHPEVQEKIARLYYAVWNKWELSKVSKVMLIGKTHSQIFWISMGVTDWISSFKTCIL